MNTFEQFIQNLEFDGTDRAHDQMFTYGHKIGNGDDDNHFSISFTSLSLLRRLQPNHNCIFHLDTTYKITKTNMPLTVFGMTDMQHRFWPISFMLSSHETTEDYVYFFENLNNMCRRLDIEFNPAYIVTDACKAMKKALELVYPNCQTLMCWFHVKFNLKKKKNLISDYKKTMIQVNELYRCPDETEYNVFFYYL